LQEVSADFLNEDGSTAPQPIREEGVIIMASPRKDSAEKTEPDSMALLVDFVTTPFSVKRRSNPSAAFAEMMERFLAGTRENDEMAKAFASFQKNFKGVVLNQEDAVRLADLEARGAGDLAIKVGSWPLSVGAGLAYMYDAALETLRSTDRPIEPHLIGARAIRMLERSLAGALPIVGSMSVSALELALKDNRFADQLRDRASELEISYLNQPPGPCEYCIIEEKDKFGNTINAVCGTKGECDLLGGLLLLLLIIGLLGKLWDWLF
jgi:hypothetical protein